MKNIKKSFSVFAVLLVIFLAAALVSCVPEANEAPRIAANQITIYLVDASGALSAVNPSDFEGLQINDTKTLSAEVSPANATDKAVTWSSSNDSVVAIDASGKLTAKASGNATITVSAGGAAATLSVSVAYSVTTEAQLQAIAQNLAGYYVLQNDISLTQEWTPLGSRNTPFTGTLDGGGFSVKNLWIDEPSTLSYAIGLIAENTGTITNIGLELGSQGVAGGAYLGALVGFNRGYVSGRVSGAGKVTGLGEVAGGLVGLNRGGTVIGYATVDVVGKGIIATTGGLVGESSGRVVGYATGAVSGASNVGGLVGYVSDGIAAGYATGVVAGTDISNPGQNVNEIGGLIGSISRVSISGYARGAVSTDSTYTTAIGPSVGRGDAALAANIYYSESESTVSYKGPSGTAAPAPNTLGTKVSVTTSTAQSAFPNLIFGSDVGEWTFYTGTWPAINFPADTIFDSVRGDKQPIAP